MLSHLPARSPVKHKSPLAVDAATPIPGGVLIALHFDGAVRPNPGQMGIGYTLSRKWNSLGASRVHVRVGAQIGHGTNNEAEYHALISGLRHALRLGMWRLEIESDSLLVVNQLLGHWQVKDKRLARLCEEARRLRKLLSYAGIKHVPREMNTVADELSHQIVFEEPTGPLLGGPGPRGYIGRKLADWQAAAIRVWSLRDHPGAGLLSRIFGVQTNVIEAIADGRSYRDADFSHYGDWIAQLNIPLPALSSPDERGNWTGEDDFEMVG